MNNRDKEKLEDAFNFIESGIKQIDLGLRLIKEYIGDNQ